MDMIDSGMEKDELNSVNEKGIHYLKQFLYIDSRFVSQWFMLF